MRFLILTAAVVAACSATANAGTPHPFHTSMAEVEYNPQTKRFEISLKLYAVDAETALSRINGKACDLDDETSRDRLMERYLSKRFQTESTTKVKPAVTGNDDKKKKKNPAKPKLPQLVYVGSQLSGADVWAYFELPSHGKHFKLRNEVLTEIQHEQLNIVRFKGPAGTQTLYFNRDNKLCSLSLAKKIVQKPRGTK